MLKGTVPTIRGCSLMASQPRQEQIEQLRDKGYAVVPRFVPVDELTKLNEAARAQLVARKDPLEFEADLQYPGAPPSRTAAGGETLRRRLYAHGRAAVFARWGAAPAVGEWMRAYFGEDVLMSLAHHNCLMTKHPLYGSLTHWHRDIRYWSFEREDLVSVWLALGREEPDSGALWFAPGDAVFFHCNTLHSAGRNLRDAVKFSLVYTYHGGSNAPKPGTRSASKP